MSVTIRVNENIRQILRQLAKQEGKTMQAVLEQAVDKYRRTQFLESINAGYSKLKKNPALWEEFQAETRELDETILDGLEDEK